MKNNQTIYPDMKLQIALLVLIGIIASSCAQKKS